MKLVKGICLIVLLVAWLHQASGVRADGLFVPPYGRQVSQTAQKAVIFYDGDQETLVLSPSFQGDATEFGWIIPTPNRPEVDKSGDTLFVALEELIKPRRPLSGPSFFDSLFGMQITNGRVGEEVKVWEQKKVDVYEISVLTARSELALINWLQDSGFVIPKGGMALFAEYVAKDWFFTTVKIGDQAGMLTEAQLQSGHATPLRLTFQSDRLVYPLKITGLGSYGMTPVAEPVPQGYPVEEPLMISTPAAVSQQEPAPPLFTPPPFSSGMARSFYPPSGPVELRLYLFADHKQTILGFETVYAGGVSKEIFAQIADLSPERWLRDRGDAYLTVLNKFMTLGEMTADLYPRQAEDDLPVGGGAGSLVRLSRVVLVGAVVVVLEVLALVVYLVIKRR